MSDLALKLIEENIKSKSKFLDLGNCALRELPEKLFECNWLENLNLGHNYYSLQKEYLEPNNNLSLNIFSGNDLTQLERLSNLKGLNISNSDIIETNFLKGLKKLVLLNLENNGIHNIESISDLTELKYLYLTNNNIKNLDPIFYLNKLDILNVSNNLISDLTPVFHLLQNGINIEFVDFFFSRQSKMIAVNKNPIANPPSDVVKEGAITVLKWAANRNAHAAELIKENLKEKKKLLDLGNCNIQHFIGLEELAECKHVEELILSNEWAERNSQGWYRITSKNKNKPNVINRIPHEISSLINLKKLILGGNWNTDKQKSKWKIRDVSDLLGLKNLIHLNISNNNLSNIETLKSLTKLKKLHINNNYIQTIHDIHLNYLQELNLSNNLIEKIEFIAKLKALNHLELHSNKISDIRTLLSIENLLHKKNFFINIAKNPLISNNNIIVSKIENQRITLLNLINSKESQKLTLPAKVLLLGNHASGKSSLLNFLQNDTLLNNSNSTHILNIEKYPKDANIPEAIFYDFGGQDYYHGIYRVFLSFGAIQILLWNEECNFNEIIDFDKNKVATINYNLLYWLEQKKYLETKSKVVYLQNNAEEVENSPVLLVQRDSTKEVPYSEVCNSVRTNLNILGEFKLCLKKSENDKRNEKTKNLLEKSREHFKSMLLLLIEQNKKEVRKKKWYINLFTDILDETVYNHDPVNLNFLITKYKIPKRDHIYFIDDLKQLHRQGLILYYNDNDKIWLNPSSLVNYINTDVLKKQVLIRNKGLLPLESLEKHESSGITQLLESQKVIFKTHYGNTFKYVVPSYLELSKNDRDYSFFSYTIKSPIFILKFKNFIPFGLINLLTIFFGINPEQKKFWRDQLLFTFNKKLILIELKIESLEIRLHCNESITLEEKKYIFYTIIALYKDKNTPFTFEEFLIWKDYNTNDDLSDKEINDDFKNKLYEYYCDFFDYPKDLYISFNDKEFVNHSELQGDDNGETIDNRSIIQTYNYKDNKFIAYKQIPIKPFEIFTNKKFTKVKKIFISYSNEDIFFKKELEKHLKPLSHLKLAKSWSCEEITPGLWDDEIQDELKSSDIVVFMLSINFISSDYILKDELFKVLLEMKNNPNKKIVCILVREFSWRKYEKLLTLSGIDNSMIEDAMDNENKAAIALTQLPKYQFLPYYTEDKDEQSKRFIKAIEEWEFKGKAFSQVTDQIISLLN
ncbi:leucine-rich repeat domain-containing protein [Flavobacterium sp. AG291]|uniref:leucine-rich repeat domain-containing protein n=1 Tax=Flavobacterium sp. AG291 TaxID=2184000 RepID=UPI000E09F0F4|nr:leucine-rich repeat domain-containing protein [Flavobacterium sp. AG291]RDI14501.1 leucine rich repeat (LRR) protein [Flavobacterium sp. AG291]